MKVMEYFDLVFIKIYYQYIRWNDKSTPETSAILILSLFQGFNVLFFIFLIKGFLQKTDYDFSKINLLFVAFLVLLFNYIRIFRVIGFEKFISKYEAKRDIKLPIHPIFYFLISLILLVILRIFGFFPHII